MRTLVFRGVAILISLALLAWLVTDARWEGVGERLRAIGWPALAIVAVLFATSYAMRGARIHGEFRHELGPGSGAARYLRILRVTLVHNALVNVLPFRTGEVAFPVLLNRWFGVPTARAVVSLLWLRAQDALVVAALAAVIWPDVPLALRALALAGIVGIAIGVPWWARRHPEASAVGERTSSRTAKLRALLARSTRRNRAGWSWTVANWTVKLVAEAWLLTLALGPTPLAPNVTQWPIDAAALGAIGAELAAILPIQGVAGFGTFEAGAAALMRTQDVALQTGLEAALALHAVVLALALIAGALAAVLLPGPPSPDR